jgi:hypothetical protein
MRIDKAPRVRYALADGEAPRLKARTTKHTQTGSTK